MKNRKIFRTGLIIVLCLCLLGGGYALAASGQVEIWATALQYELEITEPVLEELPDGQGRFSARAACSEGVTGESVSIVVAFYDGDGRQLDCWLGSHTLAAENELIVEGTLPDYAKVGVYFFESESFTPIRPSVMRLLDGQVQITSAQLSEVKTELLQRIEELEDRIDNIAVELSAADYGVISGAVDMEKMNELLQIASEQNKTIRFSDGVYVFSDTVKIMSNTSLVGSTNTVFTLSPESSSDTLMSVASLADNVFISHIVLRGEQSDLPTTEGNKIGLCVDGALRVNIENVEISGFDKYGFYGANMSSNANGEFYKMLQITNCRFYNNYYGMCLGKRCEYTQVLNCVFGNNNIGCLNQGGNNSYVSCIFNVNNTGFRMDSKNLSNPAHGGCNGCTFNHNTQAIEVNDCTIGWIFDGCQIFYGTVDLKESCGVVFNACIFGSCKLNSTNPDRQGVNLISDSFFQTDSDAILSGNDGSTMVVNCLPDFTYGNSNGDTTEEDPSLLLYTKEADVSTAASVDAYFAPITCYVAPNTYISTIEIAVMGATASEKTVNSLDVWVGNANTGEVTEHVVRDESTEVVWSTKLNKYVLSVEISKNFDYPVFFAMEAERTNGIGIAYGYSASNVNHFNGDGIAVGDVLSVNSNLIPEFAVYASEDTAEKSAPSSLWAGKSVVFVGDSISAGTGTTKTYCEYLEESMGFGKVTVMGVPGSCMSTTSDYGTGRSPLINRWENIPDADLIVVFMGTNDYGHETPLGSISDSGDVSFYGALNTIVPGIISAHPDSRVVFMTPLHRYGAGSSALLGEKFTYDYLPNGRGHSLDDYVEAIKAVCERWSVPVIDLYAESGIHPAIADQKADYMPDGIHPNAAGHEKISCYIANCLELYGSSEKAREDETPQAPADPADTVLRYGNKFVTDSFSTNRQRASSATNLWLTVGQTVTLLDTESYTWALAGTDSAESSAKTHGYYPEAQWSSVASYTVQKEGWYGVTILRTDGGEFDFSAGGDSDRLFDYISIE